MRARGEGGHDRRRRGHRRRRVGQLDRARARDNLRRLVQQDCERVKGATPATPPSLYFTERKWIRQDSLPQRTVVLLLTTLAVAGEGGRDLLLF